MNITSLGKNDTFDEECNLGTYIVFCTPFGASFIGVIGLIVVDGAYRVASTATAPSAAYIADFIDAWARLSKFILDNSLEPKL